MLRRAARRSIRVLWRLEQEVAPHGRGPMKRLVRLVPTRHPRYHNGDLDSERLDLVQERLGEALDGPFGGAVGPEAGDTEGAGRGGEEKVVTAAAGAGAEVREGALEDVQGAESVCGELGADFVGVLVFASTDYSYRE